MTLVSGAAPAGNGAVAFHLCLGCGLCAKACPTGAMCMEESYMPKGQARKHPTYNSNKCIHCGRCAVVCVPETVSQERRPTAEAVRAAGTHTVVFICSQQNMLMGNALLKGVPAENMPLSAARMYPQYDALRIPSGVHAEVVRGVCRVGVREMYGLLALGVKKIKVYACPPKVCPHKNKTCFAHAHVAGLADTLRQYGVSDVALELFTGTFDSMQALTDDIARFAAAGAEHAG